MEHIVSDKKPLVYWHEYDEPMKCVDAKTLEERWLKGEYRCDNPLVGKVWFIGHLDKFNNNELVMGLEILLKNGEIGSFKVKNNNDLEEAEKWLQSIEKQ